MDDFRRLTQRITRAYQFQVRNWIFNNILGRSLAYQFTIIVVQFNRVTVNICGQETGQKPNINYLLAGSCCIVIIELSIVK